MKKILGFLFIILIILALWLGRNVLSSLTTSIFSSSSNEVSTDSGLVGYWDMNLDGGADGTVYDKSRYSNHGVNHGATPIEGKVGAGMSFDGESDYVDMGDPADGSLDFGTGDFSISLWFKRTRSGVSEMFVDKKLVDSNNNGYYLRIESNNVIRSKIANGSTFRESLGSITISDTSWHHVVYSADRDGIGAIYVDGVYDTGSDSIASASAWNLDSYRDLNIGRTNANSSFFSGSIDEVRIYNTTLTQAEITTLYNEGANQGQIVLNGQTDDTSLIGWWPLRSRDEVIGETDLLDGWDFTNWTGWEGGTSPTFNTFNSSADGGGLIKSGIATVGKRYRFHVVGSMTGGSLGIGNWDSTQALKSFNATTPFDITIDFIPTGTNSRAIGLYNSGTSETVTITSMSLREIQTEDLSVNGNNGVSTNTPVFTTDHHGNSAMAMDFNGTSDYVNLGNILDLDKDDPVTFSFWVYPDVLETAAILSKSDTPVNGYKGWNIFTIGGAVVYRNYYAGTGTGIRVEANDSLASTQWNYVTISYDGSEDASGVKIYYDGVLQEDTDARDAGFDGSTLNDLDITLGKYSYDDSGHLDGKLTDFRIYNRVLSTDEITELYRLYNPSISAVSQTKGLVAHWPLTLEQSNSAVMKDLGSGGNDGTATSSPEIGSRGIKFNGTDQYIDIGDTSQTAIKTLSFWIQADDITSHTDYSVDLNGTDYISIVDGEVTLGGFADGTNIIYTDSVSAEATIPDITNWHHVIITSTTGRNVSDMDIARLEGTGYHDGKIADVKMWDRVLSAEEITQTFNLGRSHTSRDKAVNFVSTSSQYASLTDDGTAGSAQDFDIIDDEDFMFETWLKTSNKSGFYIFGSKRVASASVSLGWMTYLYNDFFYFEIGDGTNYINKRTNDGLENDTWMHFVGTYDSSAGTATIYTNGVSRGSNTNANMETVVNSSRFSVGASSAATSCFRGEMDNVRVYNFGADGLPSDIENIVSYNYGKKGRIHEHLKSYLVEAYEFNGDLFATKDARHDLTNNNGATFVKP